MQRLLASGIELAYDIFGDEANEAIVLISGLGTQRIRWADPFCLTLATRGYQVIRFDNRDAGGSTHFHEHAAPDFNTLAATLMAGRRPPVPYTLYDMAHDVVGLLDALSIQRAHMVGRSMGGMIAQVLASEHADRVASLTSIMSGTGNPSLPGAAPDVMAMMMSPAPDPRLDEAAYVAHKVAFARRIAGSAFPFDESHHRELVKEELRRAYDPASTGRQIAAIAVAGDRRAQLATIKAPSLIVHGLDDPLVHPACGEDTASSIQGAEWMPIAGMGHDIPAPLYDRLASAIERNAWRGIKDAR
ncbi:Alpha/beta hydrolase [Pararobbsia alpina]|uniref:alpha/beta fold hydrolase n=1 Tax=Pararobbsia alpina TaxID=621374 RepID=UPI0039A40646